jgi:hypothetical protein
MKEMLKKYFRYLGWDKLALLIVLTGLIWTNLYYKFWKDPKRVITNDVILYYEYLPGAIIQKDLTMSFIEEDPAFYADKIWINKTRIGRSVSRMTMGLAVLYSPFFLAAHGLAGSLGYKPDGFSDPYRFALILSSVFYATLGFWLLLKLLRKYFARNAIAISLLAIGLGTNLYYYTTIEPPMSHAYSFFLFAAFIYAVDLWVVKPSWGISAFIGLIGGFIILVRPSNGIILILFPLWQVDSVSALRNRLKLFIHKSLKLVLIAFIACLVFVPQIIYWKYVTGEYFYNSYGDQGVFYFNDPAFLQGLFSYRKGWLVYTPVMTFALIGIIVLYFRHRKFFWPVAVFTLLYLYVVWSWWCWWYGGGFGQRALIESYALLSIPLTAFITFIFERKQVFRISFLIILVCMISLNIFQTRQYYIGVIHWDAMNKKTYWDSYFRLKVRPGFYDMVDNPDYEAALKGDR